MRRAIEDYNMIEDGDKIAVALSGGKDSLTLLYALKNLQRFFSKKFELIAISINPGFYDFNEKILKNNCKKADVELVIINEPIKQIVFDERKEKNPCSLCANLRRGILNSTAKKYGCNKIALGHHFDDVIETVLMGMFYGTQFQTMMPKLHSTNFEGMELIRPLYFVKEADIIKWRDKNNLEFINCACKITEKNKAQNIKEVGSKREEMKRLLKKLRETNEDVDMNIYNSTKKVNLDTIISYMKDGEEVSFLDNY